MLQRDANWLFGLAYALDSRKRVKDKSGEQTVVLKHTEVEKMAHDLREFAAKYEATPELIGRRIRTT